MRFSRAIPLFALAAGLILAAPAARSHGSIQHQIDRVGDLLRLDPANAPLYLERAELHRIGGFLDAAGRDLDRAAEIDPDLNRLPLCRAALELDLGHRDAARRWIDIYMSENAGDRQGLELLGKIGGANPDASPIGGGPAAPRLPYVSPNSAAAGTVIGQGATWNYLVTPTDQGTAWRDAGYDDAGWPADPAILGYGETYITTPIGYGGDANNKYRTTYFRIHFNVAEDPTTITNLVLNARYDDGFVAYLNGTELTRASMPSGTITYSTYASSHEASSYEGINVSGGIGSLVQGDNVLAVEVHQTSNGSSDLVWDCALVTSTGGPDVTRGPYLQVGTSEGVTIRWRTSVASDTRVRYGTDPANLTSFTDGPGATTEHEVPLTGLLQETRYYYSVGTPAATLAGGDSTYTFKTAPVPGTPRPVRVWAIGDSGEPTQFPDEMRDGYLNFVGNDHADVWLMLGDNAYGAGTDAQYEAAVFDMFPNELRNTILWPTRGNHDVLYSGPNNDYYEIFTMPTAGEAGGDPSGTEAWYSFDYGRVHFICLDSEGNSQSATMKTWLINDLDNTNADWVIAYWHHPPYTKGSHDSDNDVDSGARMKHMREDILPILESRGVDLVLGGHSHSYERSLLLDGHYGYSVSLDNSMKIDPGDGDPAGDGAYMKPTLGTGPNEGAVYAVAGSSSKISGGPLNHPVMVTNLNIVGSLVLDIEGNRLDAAFIDINGAALDEFSIIKGGLTGVPEVAAGVLPALAPNTPNSFRLATRIAFDLPRTTTVDLSLFDVSGRKVRTLFAGLETEGSHSVEWDGRDAAGNPVPTGVYFSVLSFDGGSKTRKLVLSR